MSFKFTKIKSLPNSLARVGEIETTHGLIATPAYIAGGTKATVKTLTNLQILDLKAQGILVNTHLKKFTQVR